MQQLQQRGERLRRALSRAGPTHAAARALQQELQQRLQQAQELDTALSQTQGALRSTEHRLQVRPRGSVAGKAPWELMMPSRVLRTDSGWWRS